MEREQIINSITEDAKRLDNKELEMLRMCVNALTASGKTQGTETMQPKYGKVFELQDAICDVIPDLASLSDVLIMLIDNFDLGVLEWDKSQVMHCADNHNVLYSTLHLASRTIDHAVEALEKICD